MRKLMDEAEIKYGSGQLHLTKSPHLVGVKTRPGVAGAAAATLAPELARPPQKGEVLGGFRVINVEDAPGGDMEAALDTLRASDSVDVATHVYHTSEDEVPFVPTGQLYVQTAPNASDDEVQALLDEHKLEITEARGEGRFIVEVTPDSANPVKTAAALQASPLIEVAEPDLATPGMLKVFAIPADELLAEQWHLRNTGQHRGTTVGFKAGADARITAAWEHVGTLGDPSVVVAVIDDGFDLTHPDLSGVGRIIAPRDFTRNSIDPVPDLASEDWHGTACAGVAVGGANTQGIVGAAPGCLLMPVRWGRNLADSEIERWFAWVTAQGASVVSCSWGAAAKVFPLSTRARDAIAHCARNGRNGLGCVIVFAAGNDNHDIEDPAGASLDGFAIHPDVIAVAATNSRDEKSNYSNFGDAVSVCAPSSGAGGWGITTSDVTGQFVVNGVTIEAGYDAGAFTHRFGGTSSACPLVAGVCALLLSIRPQLTAAEVKTLIQRTARRVGDPASYDASGHSRLHGFGCINALAAVQAITA
jgi:subtilisin family serine protease